MMLKRPAVLTLATAMRVPLTAAPEFRMTDLGEIPVL
jgi:hypothetical protein